MNPESRACEIVARTLKIQGDVGIEDNIDTLLKWDSLSHMALALELEKELGRQLSAEEIVSVSTVRAIAHLLASSDDASGP